MSIHPEGKSRSNIGSSACSHRPCWQDKRSNDVGANLFVGNLDPELDEKLLYDTFSAFGVVGRCRSTSSKPALKAPMF
jgi:RNA recognition motif-containing protein